MLNHHSAKFSVYKHYDSRDNDDFSLPLDLARPHDQRIMLFYGWKLFMGACLPAKLNSHGYCSNKYVMVLICHVVLQNHVT